VEVALDKGGGGGGVMSVVGMGFFFRLLMTIMINGVSLLWC